MLLKIKKIKESHTSEKLTDPETGMGNLVYFKHHFRHTMGDMARKLYYVAYIALDDSYVKSFYGEDSFENIVKHTALILSEHAYDREITARVSENGFVIALQSANDAEARERIETIVSRLNEAEDIKDINGKALFHVAVYNLNISDKNCEMVLFNLKKNCNKISGTENQIVFCDTNLMNRVQEEKKLTQSILNGLENNEFKIYLQFIVDNKTKKIVSAEALSRWESPAKGLINPGEYIETMEMSGLISKHDFLMFDLACKQLEAWKGTALENISISCNFTRITLSEGNFADRLKMIADSYAFDKSKLAIEITEDAMEKNQEVAMENVAKCKALGLRVYLDDLGSGYTTLINLCDYPIDVVKIDRDILNKADTLKGKELFFGIVALAHNLNIKVICEGVETEEQCEFVTKTECDLVQGWYYSKALPVEECEDFIKTRI
ncbi:MAG: EAL domain-containing protein [Clostridia bacterium]|nr:EAL domain-containing protein [Clostridia bacterium]